MSSGGPGSPFPAPGGGGPRPQPSGGGLRRVLWWGVVLMLGLFALNYYAASRVVLKGPTRVTVPYSPYFLDQVAAGNVASITSKGSAIQGRFTHPLGYPAGSAHATRTTLFATELPTFADTASLSTALQKAGVTVNAEPLSTGAPLWESLLYGFGPTLLILLLLYWLWRRAAAGANAGGALSAFGRARARRYEPTRVGVTFADVAGIDEAKAELSEIVDFLRRPGKYRKLGGHIPHGVLLAGPPGSGKTLLARAVAGEAHAPFFSLSASEFIEMIVGVGASRVRDLFSQAKAASPAIVFIDELDAIGRSRAGGIPGLGGHEEREQTLNQILTEMDGFDGTTGVIVLAATNRPDVLDPALLRPGRFDRRVTVQPPDRRGRRLILDVHTRSVRLGPDVDLDRVAASTPGMVGADLANLVNEAALLAARRDHDVVEMRDLDAALERILLGAERTLMLSPDERERTAYHEAGHAIVGMLTPGADPVRKVSIIPRGVALGVTFAAPEGDRFSWEQGYLEARIRVALGGRVAEEVVYGNVTTGAESDIRQLTEIARGMVGRWGMSDAVGPIAVLAPDDQPPVLGGVETSALTLRLVDREVRRIVEQAHGEVTALLVGHRRQLDALAHELLSKETLDEGEARAAAGIDRVAGAGVSGPEQGAGSNGDGPAVRRGRTPGTSSRLPRSRRTR
jgi:cell division protease FtsH